jgi:hypothetical protein
VVVGRRANHPPPPPLLPLRRGVIFRAFACAFIAKSPVSGVLNRRLEPPNTAVLHASVAWELGVYTRGVAGATLGLPGSKQVRDIL